MNEKIIAAIPTKYKGVNFRSRLEARWAAFFDYYDIPWEYEPIDLKGWIPDFLIPGKTNTYVEIKPTKVFLPDVWAKITRHQADMGDPDIMLLGDFIRPSTGFVDAPTSGWLGEGCRGLPEELRNEWYKTDKNLTEQDGNGYEMLWTNCGDRPLDFHHAFMSYQHRISGIHEGDHYFGYSGDMADLIAAWNTAGNEVQWKR